MKKIVVINWTDDLFDEDDIRLRFNDGRGDIDWKDTVNEYNVKTISYEATNIISQISIKSSKGSELIGDAPNAILRPNQKLIFANLIKKVDGDIVGINICDSYSNRKIKKFLVINLSDYPVWINTLNYVDGTPPINSRSKIIYAKTIELIPIVAIPLSMESDYWIGKDIEYYNLGCQDCDKINDRRLDYSGNSCSFTISGFKPNQMVVGVEISNSGSDDTLKTLH